MPCIIKCNFCVLKWLSNLVGERNRNLSESGKGSQRYVFLVLPRPSQPKPPKPPEFSQKHTVVLQKICSLEILKSAENLCFKPAICSKMYSIVYDFYRICHIFHFSRTNIPKNHTVEGSFRSPQNEDTCRSNHVRQRLQLFSFCS